MSNNILILLYVMGGLGLILSIILSTVNKNIGEKKDSKINKINRISEILPNLNCGLCGFTDCRNYAVEIAKEPESIEKCRIIDKGTFRSISTLLERENNEIQKKSAVIYCKGGRNCQNKYVYKGIETCFAANNIFRGAKSCVYGCIALGDCARICPNNAITCIPGEIPVIDKQKCRGCGTCVKICPKKVISLVPQKFDIHIRCSSIEKGRRTREICSMGCIVCGICVKICPTGAIAIKDNLAKIDYTNCNLCELCVEKCPTNTIERLIK